MGGRPKRTVYVNIWWQLSNENIQNQIDPCAQAPWHKNVYRYSKIKASDICNRKLNTSTEFNSSIYPRKREPLVVTAYMKKHFTRRNEEQNWKDQIDNRLLASRRVTLLAEPLRWYSRCDDKFASAVSGSCLFIRVWNMVFQPKEQRLRTSQSKALRISGSKRQRKLCMRKTIICALSQMLSRRYT
jgi:hypothetical protein